MGRRETRADREARRARNAKRREEERAKAPPPVNLRRLAEHQRAQAKAEAAAKAWDLVLQAAAAFAPGPAEFRYAGLTFTDPADATAYNAEFKAAIEAAGADGEGPIGRWRTWAAVAMPWIERRKLRPAGLGPGQLPRCRVYPDGVIRLVAPTDGDMVALLSRATAGAAPAVAAEEAAPSPAATPAEGG